MEVLTGAADWVATHNWGKAGEVTRLSLSTSLLLHCDLLLATLLARPNQEHKSQGEQVTFLVWVSLPGHRTGHGQRRSGCRWRIISMECLRFYYYYHYFTLFPKCVDSDLGYINYMHLHSLFLASWKQLPFSLLYWNALVRKVPWCVVLRVTWHEVMFRWFTRRDIQMAGKNMTKCLIALIIKQIKIEKTNMILCFSIKKNNGSWCCLLTSYYELHIVLNVYF